MCTCVSGVSCFILGTLFPTSIAACTNVIVFYEVLGYKFVTIAADLVLESVTEPIRFKRSVYRMNMLHCTRTCFKKCLHCKVKSLTIM